MKKTSADFDRLYFNSLADPKTGIFRKKEVYVLTYVDRYGRAFYVYSGTVPYEQEDNLPSVPQEGLTPSFMEFIHDEELWDLCSKVVLIKGGPELKIYPIFPGECRSQKETADAMMVIPVL